MKLCVYCGTFNPIHSVHIAVANFIKKNFEFDSILFIPAYKPPHKNIDDELANHRYNMVRLAIQGDNKFSISNIEFRHEKYSYTFNTIEQLYKMYPNIDIEIEKVKGDSEYWDAMKMRASANQLPDIMFNKTFTFSKFKDYLVDLSSTTAARKTDAAPSYRHAQCYSGLFRNHVYGCYAGCPWDPRLC